MKSKPIESRLHGTRLQNILDLAFIAILFILTGLLLSGCAQNIASQPGGKNTDIPLRDCQLSSPGSPVHINAKCGQLTVFEDRSTKAGRQITLNFATIPAVSRNPEPDPLFFLTGGPGQAATESYPVLSAAFERIHQKRDIILVDQRGTGKSHPLTCTGIDDSGSDSMTDQELADRLRECLSKLDADPTQYTTSIAMQDLDQVREALGYGRINLYGVSYGTRAALTYLSLFPKNVRSVILDGIVPQDEPLGISIGRDAQRALDMIFSRCDRQLTCNQAFPDVREEFNKLLETVGNSPVDVTLPNPTSGEDTQIKFTAEKLGTAVRLFSYAPETAALLPLLIHDTYAHQEYQLLAATYLIVVEELQESITNGMGYSVLCAEDMPFYTVDEAEKVNAGSYLGNATSTQLFKICQVWPHAQVPPDFKKPVQSDVPVLLLSGEADPVTPPENGNRVAQTLSNSLHLIVPGQGHNVIFRGCIPRIASEFIEAGSIKGLSTGCVRSILPLPIFVNFSGPIPDPREGK